MEKRNRLRKRLIFLLTLFLVIAITVAIFIYRDRMAELESYGYLGAFLVSLVSNATIVLPIPGIIVILALSSVLPAVLLGLTAGAGAAIGELTSYMAGFSGQGLMGGRRELYDKLVMWLRKWGAIVVFIFALTPLPFDLIGIVAGALRFPLWKFLLACWLGKTIFYILAALFGAWWWEAIVA